MTDKHKNVFSKKTLRLYQIVSVSKRVRERVRVQQKIDETLPQK